LPDQPAPLVAHEVVVVPPDEQRTEIAVLKAQEGKVGTDRRPVALEVDDGVDGQMPAAALGCVALGEPRLDLRSGLRT